MLFQAEKKNDFLIIFRLFRLAPVPSFFITTIYLALTKFGRCEQYAMDLTHWPPVLDALITTSFGTVLHVRNDLKTV